jgi:predicted DNA-binding protein
MMVSPEIQKRLDNLWDRLQQLESTRQPGISQIGLDETCIDRLEDVVTAIEEMHRLKHPNFTMNGITP